MAKQSDLNTQIMTDGQLYTVSGHLHSVHLATISDVRYWNSGAK